MIVAELKVGANKITAEQAAWLWAFMGVGIRSYVWRPDDWPAIELVLSE